MQGFEIQKVLALVDWFEREKSTRIGLIGWGEGGMLALQAGALDTRVDAVCVSGQFGPREDMWREPLERNLFGFINVIALAYGDQDTPPELLDGNTVEMRFTVTDALGREESSAVQVIAWSQ